MNNDELIMLEKELADLLGFTRIEIEKFALGDLLYGTPAGCGPEDEHILPQWARDDAAAFQLMCDHEIPVISFDETAHAYGISSEAYSSHGGDRRKATRVALVRAAIAKLKGA